MQCMRIAGGSKPEIDFILDDAPKDGTAYYCMKGWEFEDTPGKGIIVLYRGILRKGQTREELEATFQAQKSWPLYGAGVKHLIYLGYWHSTATYLYQLTRRMRELIATA